MSRTWNGVRLHGPGQAGREALGVARLHDEVLRTPEQEDGHANPVQTVHEPPFLVDDSDMALESGMVINVEPTMRIKGIGSVNIEDTLVVRDGEPERLTTVPQELEHYSPRP